MLISLFDNDYSYQPIFVNCSFY